MSKQKAADALIGFGFTALESAVYAFLLQESPATGYRIAQSIGKPAANTYKAIESLDRKGAIILEESGSRMCRPVDPEALLNRLTKEFSQRKSSALKSFAGLGAPPVEGALVSVTTADQAIREAVATTLAAEGVLLVYGSAHLIDQMLDELETAVSAGVDVYVLVDRAFFLEGATVMIAAITPSEGTVLEIGSDESTYLGVAISGPSAQGILAKGSPVAAQHFHGLLTKVGIQLIRKVIEEDGSKKQIAKILESLP